MSQTREEEAENKRLALYGAHHAVQALKSRALTWTFLRTAAAEKLHLLLFTFFLHVDFRLILLCAGYTNLNL